MRYDFNLIIMDVIATTETKNNCGKKIRIPSTTDRTLLVGTGNNLIQFSHTTPTDVCAFAANEVTIFIHHLLFIYEFVKPFNAQAKFNSICVDVEAAHSQTTDAYVWSENIAK